MGILESLARRGDIPSIAWPDNMKMPFGGSNRQTWGSGFNGMKALTDAERKKLYMLQLEILQKQASRNTPSFAAMAKQKAG